MQILPHGSQDIRVNLQGGNPEFTCRYVLVFRVNRLLLPSGLSSGNIGICLQAHMGLLPANTERHCSLLLLLVCYEHIR